MINPQYRIDVFQKLYSLPVYQRNDIFRLADELVQEDRLSRKFTFWVYNIVYDKFFGYQECEARRLMF